MRLTCFKLFLFVALLSLPCGVPGLVETRPNFVIIAADDLGYDDLGIHGNLDVETPVLDRLATESVRFESFYVNPVCAPTRAGLLTGRHFLRTGVWGVHGNRDYLDLNEQTFADALREAGYKTGIFGKWHNGVTDGYFPWDRGFDEACMVDLYQYFNNVAQCNGQTTATTGWVTARITDWAMDFIRRNKGGSFSVMIPYMTPHLGKLSGDQSEFWHAPEASVGKYLAKGLSDPLARLYGMIDFMDANIGRLLQMLEAEGLSQNTVVIFLSDNGPIGNNLMSAADWQRRNVHQLRGNKGDVYENGIRVPLFIRWPNRYAPRSVDLALITVEDLFPTLMEMAGVFSVRNSLDGISMVPILRDPSQDDEIWKGRTLFFTKAAPDWTRADNNYFLLPDEGRDKSGLVFGRGGAWAVRRRQYKYINSFGTESLFDLQLDPQERQNLPDLLRRDALEETLRGWWAGILAEPKSFGRPRFYIGRSQFSEIFFMGAFDKSDNVIIRSHSVQGDVSPGTFLKYRAIVANPGTYDVRVRQWSDWVGEITVDVFCGEMHAAANGALDGELDMRIDIPFAGDNCIVQFKIRNGTGPFQAPAFSFTSV